LACTPHEQSDLFDDTTCPEARSCRNERGCLLRVSHRSEMLAVVVIEAAAGRRGRCFLLEPDPHHRLTLITACRDAFDGRRRWEPLRVVLRVSVSPR